MANFELHHQKFEIVFPVDQILVKNVCESTFTHKYICVPTQVQHELGHALLPHQLSLPLRPLRRIDVQPLHGAGAQPIRKGIQPADQHDFWRQTHEPAQQHHLQLLANDRFLQLWLQQNL